MNPRGSRSVRVTSQRDKPIFLMSLSLCRPFYGGSHRKESFDLHTPPPKYDQPRLIVRSYDPSALLILKEHVHIQGNFTKKLEE